MALIGRETSTGLTRLQNQTPKKKLFWGIKSNCAYRVLCTGHVHGSTERCDWLIVSQQGDSPIFSSEPRVTRRHKRPSRIPPRQTPSESPGVLLGGF